MRELTALGHGIPGVHRQIHDHLLDLAGIHFHRADGRTKNGTKLHVLANQPAQHLLDIGDDDVEIQNFRLQNLLAAEGQKLASQGGRALRRRGGSDPPFWFLGSSGGSLVSNKSL